jgi:hypothetical protein
VRATPVVVDAAGDVGRYTSLALDSLGRPVVSYWDVTNGDLKVLRCGDATCTAGNAIGRPDTAGDVGAFSSLALDAAGRPVVSYYDATNQDLKVLRCGDATCAGGNSITSPDTAGDVGGFTSLALDFGADPAGIPVVSYFFGTTGVLRVLRCGDATCAGGNALLWSDSPGGVWTSLALDAAGSPVVGHLGLGGSVEVLRCTDPACLGAAATVLDTGMFLDGTSLALDGAGYPVLSYYDEDADDLWVVRCGDPACTADNTGTSPHSAGSVGAYSSLALDAAGRPVVSYYDRTNGALRVLRCGNPACTSENTITTPDTAGDVGQYTSLVLDAAGHPVIAYYDAGNGDLKVLRCTTPTCG